MSGSKRRGRRAAAVVVAALGVAGCSSSSSQTADQSRPATVEAVAGSDLKTVTLTDQAAQRIDVQTSPTAAGSAGLQIPYAAVLYDPHGNAWAFVKTAELTFVRNPITIDHIIGDTAYLTSGPLAGVNVVTTGAAELYGAELGIGEEE